MNSQSFLVSLLCLSILTAVIFSQNYRGLRDGKSQCYPYSVPHAESIGQGGNQ